MRKLIIDSDGGADDAVAVALALRSKEVEVLAVTAVCGNIDLDQAVTNLLAVVEAAEGQRPAVHRGADRKSVV